MKRTLVVALLAVALVLPASAAWAARSLPIGVPAKAVPSSVDVQLWAEDVGNKMTVVVVATIPTATPLPATVSVPLPKGALVTWAGEIFPDAKQDVPRKPTVAPDGLSLTIETTKSRLVQYEAQYATYVDRGGRRYVALEWVQTQPAGAQQFAVKFPLTSDDPKTDPAFTGAPAINGAGEKLYFLPDQKLKVGQKLTIAADYIPRLPQAPVQKSPLDYVLPVALGLLGLVVVALIVVVARSRPTSAGGGDRDDGWDDGED